MLDRLRSQFAHELSGAGVALFCLAAGVCYRIVPVRFKSNGLEFDCLVPRWADTSTWLGQGDSAVSLITRPEGDRNLRWLEVEGWARVVRPITWAETLPQHSRVINPEELYEQVRIRPRRIHQFDESAGWGVQATLDL